MAEYQVIDVDGEPVQFPVDMSDDEISQAILANSPKNIIPSNDPAVPTNFKNPIDFQEIKDRPKDYTISPANVALAGLITSVGGGLYAKIAKTGGSALVGALEGGIAGATSSAAGELIKEATNNSNVGQLMALGGEMLSGAALPLTRDLITRVPQAALMASMGYAKAKSAQAVLGVSESSRIAKNAIFGKEVVKPGVATTRYTEEFDVSSSMDIANRLNINIPQGMKAQDVIRRDLYDTLSLQGASGVTIKNSPIYSELMQDLVQGVKDGIVKSEDIKSIATLLNGQNSPNSKTLVSFNQRLLNTAQQATAEQNGVKISDDAADMLKGAIDKYTGKPFYKLLKEQEKQRFTAQAMDDIPVLLSKGIKSDDLEKTLGNLAKNPQGKENFKIALGSYLKSLPEKEALSEWNRLYSSKVLTKTQVMGLGDILNFNRKVKLYTEKGYLKKAGDITGQALKMGIVNGILPAETINRGSEMVKDGLSGFKTL
jgi:hypothetical protein